jgi:hypothetical protein
LRSWWVDTDFLAFVANGCFERGGLEGLVVIPGPEPGRQYLSAKTEGGAIETIRKFMLDCVRAYLPSLPQHPDFTAEPLHDSLEPFIYLGFVAIRAFIRGKHRLLPPQNYLYYFTPARESAMAEEANLFIVGEMETYDPQVAALEKQKKKARKRAAKKAAKAKENENNNAEVTEGDTAVEANNNAPTEAATDSKDAATADIAPARNEAVITNPAPAITAPPGHAHDDRLTTMEMATQALSMYGARPPPGLSQYLGMPIRPPAARSVSAVNTDLADATSVVDPADAPAPRHRRRRDGRRRPAPGASTGAAPATEAVTEDIMQPLPESQRHGRNETIEEYQRRTAPPVAPTPTEYRVHSLNNEQLVVTGTGPASFTAAVRDMAGAVTSGVNLNDPAAIARTMMSVQASLPAGAATSDATEPDFASIARAIMNGQAPPPRGAFLGPSNISPEDIRDAMSLVDNSSTAARATSRAAAGANRIPVQPRQTAAAHLPDLPRAAAASRGAGPPRQTAASRRAMQKLYDEIEAELDAAQGLDPVARRAAFAQAQQRLLRSETLAAARQEMGLRPTATAATQAALFEGRDDALNAVREQRRAAQAQATRNGPSRQRTGTDAINSRAREQGYSFDIGGMPGWLGELEQMQMQGLRDEHIAAENQRVAEENQRRLAERMRVVRERRAAAVEALLDRSAQIDREAEEESHREMAAAEEREKKENEERNTARKAADEANKAADEAKKAEKKAKIAAKRAERKAKK